MIACVSEDMSARQSFRTKVICESGRQCTGVPDTVAGRRYDLDTSAEHRVAICEWRLLPHMPNNSSGEHDCMMLWTFTVVVGWVVGRWCMGEWRIGVGGTGVLGGSRVGGAWMIAGLTFVKLV